MIVVIPLGGVGKRFSDLGYKDPKPLIKVLGKEIIFWVVDNLKLKKIDKLYIVYNNQLEKFSFEEHFTRYSNINFLKLERNTSGPVETIYELTSILEKNLKPGTYVLKNKNDFCISRIIDNINNSSNKKIKINWLSKKVMKEKMYNYKNLTGCKPLKSKVNDLSRLITG